MYTCFLRKHEIAQKWILKIMFGKSFRFSTDLFLGENEFFDLSQLHFQSLCSYHFKVRNDLVNIEHEHKTRFSQQCFMVPKMNKTIDQRMLIFLGPRVINILPESTKNITRYTKFKNSIKKYQNKML